jgi:hypothetical protein
MAFNIVGKEIIKIKPRTDTRIVHIFEKIVSKKDLKIAPIIQITRIKAIIVPQPAVFIL